MTILFPWEHYGQKFDMINEAHVAVILFKFS